MNTPQQNSTTKCPSDALRDVGEHTFESLAFMFTMPQEEEPTTTVRVSFSGPSCGGALYLTVSSAMLAQLAVNMMGIADGVEPTAAQQVDALKEIGNVICGNVLPVIAGAQAEFSIAAPEALAPQDSRPPLPSEEPLARARLKLDGGSAELKLYMDASPEKG